MIFDRFTARHRLHAAYERVFGSPEGQIVLADLCRTHGVLHTIMSQAPDGMARALDMAHADGARYVVLSIVQKLSLDLDDLIEQAKQEEANARSDSVDNSARGPDTIY